MPDSVARKYTAILCEFRTEAGESARRGARVESEKEQPSPSRAESYRESPKIPPLRLDDGVDDPTGHATDLDSGSLRTRLAGRMELEQLLTQPLLEFTATGGSWR